MIKAINIRAVSLMRYSKGIIDWTKEELDNVDRKTRKLTTMHGMLHPRLYLPRAEGGRGLMSVADTVNIERSLQRHVNTTQEKLLTIAKKYMKEEERGPKEFEKDRKEERQRDWAEKPLHGRFFSGVQRGWPVARPRTG